MELHEHDHRDDRHEHGQHQDHDHGHGWRGRLRHALVPHSHDAADVIRNADESSRLGIRAAWIGLAGMSATAALQMAIVAASGSVALLADTIHNLGHAVTTIPLVVAFRLGRRPPSARWPYGLRRAEDLAGLLVGLVVAVSVVLIFAEAVDALLHPRPVTDLGWVLAAGLVGFAGNEAVAVHRIRTGRRIGSAALIAEGQHARADGLTSIAVVIGVVGVWAGFDRADAIIGFLIGLTVLGILVSSMRTVVRRLLDGVDDVTLERLTDAARGVPGVLEVGRVRARWSGHRLEADAVIGVEPALDVASAARLADEVERALQDALPALAGATIRLTPNGGLTEPAAADPR